MSPGIPQPRLVTVFVAADQDRPGEIARLEDREIGMAEPFIVAGNGNVARHTEGRCLEPAGDRVVSVEG